MEDFLNGVEKEVEGIELL